MMRSTSEICSELEKAFSPLRCVAEIWDYGHKIRFKVFDENDKTIFEMREVVIDSVRHGSSLQDVCDAVQLRINSQRQ